MSSLRRSPPLTRLPRRPSKLFDPKTFLAHAGLGRTVHRYRPKQTVFLQGERADAVFYIQEGKVKVFVVSDQGKEAVVALHGNGDFFGEGCLIWSAASLGDCLGEKPARPLFNLVPANHANVSQFFSQSGP